MMLRSARERERKFFFSRCPKQADAARTRNKEIPAGSPQAGSHAHLLAKEQVSQVGIVRALSKHRGVGEAEAGDPEESLERRSAGGSKHIKKITEAAKTCLGTKAITRPLRRSMPSESNSFATRHVGRVSSESLSGSS